MLDPLRRLAAGTLLFLLVGLLHAQGLQSRDINRDGAIDAFYDPSLGITWLADASAAGALSWEAARAWATSLEVHGVTGWRLPNVRPVNGSHYQVAPSNNATTDNGYATTGLGWGSASELGHMFYVTLGNMGSCAPTGGPTFTCVQLSGWGLADTGPFNNLLAASYWSETSTGAAGFPLGAWAFDFFTGAQFPDHVVGSETRMHAWAVRDGDVAALAVPEPSTFALLLLGLAALSLRRKLHGTNIKRASGAVALAVGSTLVASAEAQPITLQYEVSITERANVLRNGATPHDQRVNLSLGEAQPFSTTFRMTMTFEFVAGHAGSGLDYFLHYGTPTFSAFPLPAAEPLVFAGDTDVSILRSGGTIEQQSVRPEDGSSWRNWGAFLGDSVIRAGDVQSGSTTILSHMRPATFAGPWEFDRNIPLATYLEHMQGDLEFDFTTWTYFYPTGDFTADSYNYRGTAQSVGAVPEPSTYLLMLVGLLAVAIGKYQAKDDRSPALA